MRRFLPVRAHPATPGQGACDDGTDAERFAAGGLAGRIAGDASDEGSCAETAVVRAAAGASANDV